MVWTAETWPFLLVNIVEHLTTSPLLRCLVSWPCELLWPLLCKKMNAQASPGFDLITAPFIEYAIKQISRASGKGTERFNVLF
jgi:hypothetical protein